MLNIKALLNKFMDVYTYDSTNASITGINNSRFTSLSSLHNNMALLNKTIYNLGLYGTYTYYTTAHNASYFQLMDISVPTGGVTNSAYTIGEFYHGYRVGTYFIYQGYLSTWASSTSTSGTQYRQAATLTLSSSQLPVTASSSIPICLVSIMNTRVVNCSAAFTAARTMTINAILSTSGALSDSNAYCNIFVYQPYTSNSGTLSSNLVIH